MKIIEAIDLIREVVGERADDRTDWERIVEAWGMVEGHATPRNTIASIKIELEDIEQVLAEMLVDAQDAAEEAGNFSPGMFTGDNDDIPVCVPEDAAPGLDCARSLIQDAIGQLEEE